VGPTDPFKFTDEAAISPEKGSNNLDFTNLLGFPPSFKQQKGDFIDQCMKAYTADPDPSLYGNCRALWYSGSQETPSQEPILTFGPQWWCPLLELLIVNTVAALFMHFGNFT